MVNLADPLEKSLERMFFKAVRSLGGISLKLVPTLAGPPDRLVLLNGRCFLVELKREDGTVSPVQKMWHSGAARRGVPVYVLWGKEGVRAWLKAVVALDDPKPGRPKKCPESPTLTRLNWYGDEYNGEDA